MHITKRGAPIAQLLLLWFQVYQHPQNYHPGIFSLVKCHLLAINFWRLCQTNFFTIYLLLSQIPFCTKHLNWVFMLLLKIILTFFPFTIKRMCLALFENLESLDNFQLVANFLMAHRKFLKFLGKGTRVSANFYFHTESSYKHVSSVVGYFLLPKL